MSAIRTALITGSTDPLAIGFTAGLLLAKTGEFATILLSVSFRRNWRRVLHTDTYTARRGAGKMPQNLPPPSSKAGCLLLLLRR